MPNFTLLQIIQQVQGELGLPVASSVVGNLDLTTTQLQYLANNEIDELRQEHDWTSLQLEAELNVNVPVTVTGNVGDLSGNLAVVDNVLPSTAGILANYMMVQGNAVNQAARVLSVDSPTQFTMTMPATGTVTGGTFILAQDTYPEPSGFDHFVNRSWWDRTNRWELLGPDSVQMDQWHRSGIVATGPRRHFIQIGPGLPGFGQNNFRIWPPPAEIVNPLSFAYVYITNTPIVVTGAENASGTGTFSRTWTSDSDIALLDDRAIIKGVKWRFWQIKGFDYTTLYNNYLDYINRLKARDGGAPTLNIVKRVHPIFVSPANVQDGFYPGPVGPNAG